MSAARRDKLKIDISNAFDEIWEWWAYGPDVPEEPELDEPDAYNEDYCSEDCEATNLDSPVAEAVELLLISRPAKLRLTNQPRWNADYCAIEGVECDTMNLDAAHDANLIHALLVPAERAMYEYDAAETCY